MRLARLLYSTVPSLCISIVFSTALAFAADVRITVRDPAKAVVPAASLQLTSEMGVVAAAAVTGNDGVALLKDLPEGAYRLIVTHEGFETAQQPVELKASGETAVELILKIESQQTTVEVQGGTSSLLNADPNYRALRNASLAETYLVENLQFKRDAATFTLRTGSVSFAAPVLGRVTVAVFSGKGAVHLKPASRFEADHLKLLTGESQLDDEFDSAVFVFTDGTYEELKRSLKTSADASRTTGVFENFRRRVRHREEFPRTATEYLLQSGPVINLDAETLAGLYNPDAAGAFSAYMRAHKHSDLRFLFNPLGALPSILSTEEAALVNIDANGSQDGILYLSHSEAEITNGTASNGEDRRIISPAHYKIETIIGKNEHFTSTADIRFQSLREGDRVFRLDLLPSLRVTRVSLAMDRGSQDIPFIQESKRADGALYVVMPQGMKKGQSYRLQVDYEGDKVVHNAGGGNFSVGARESWYPSMNVFRDRCTYELTFKVPRHYTLVSVGRLVDQSREGDYAVSHWTSDVPLAVAGFNYGEYKEKSVHDKDSNYDVAVFATSELPDYLRRFRSMAAMTPSAMSANAMVDTQNSLRCFQYWFGNVPYGRIAITQQPEMNFGQSWPTLVYLPVMSFLDSTQRWMMMGGHAFRFGEFIDEVTPHEVSHQWWGHLIGFSSYHDQWLSEGFADFSAGLFLETVEKKKDKYNDYWERNRKRVLEKNSFGFAPNDAGPIWMGLRLSYFKNPTAYNSVVYPKGGYVLHMLRYLMQDPKTGDDDFVKMMHEFTSRFALKNATTEDFISVVNQHMKPAMDLAGDKTSNWFFRQWVLGTEIPSYQLTYRISKDESGKPLMVARISQSGVGENFRMRVPIYLDFGQPGGPQKVANIAVMGEKSTNEFKMHLPQIPKKVLLNYYHDVLARDVKVIEE